MARAHELIRYDADGLAVAAHAWGDAEAPLALLLHGYPDSASTWRHLGPALAEAGFRAVAPFQRGYAPTALAPDGGYSLEALVGDVLASHEALGGDSQAVVVGHDWGAEQAYIATAVAPDRFRRVVALAVPPQPALDNLRRHPGLLARQLWMSRYIALQQIPGSERLLRRIVPRLWARWSPGYAAHEDVRAVLAALAPPGHATAALRYYRAVWRQRRSRGRGHPRVPELPRDLSDTPTLYLHGQNDGCISADVARLAQASVATEVVPGVGHFLHLEAPSEVNERILGFLRADSAA